MLPNATTAAGDDAVEAGGADFEDTAKAGGN